MQRPAVLLPANCALEELLYFKSYPCPCGAVGYWTLEQRLAQAPDGKLVDVVLGRCTECGLIHEFRFEPRYALGQCLPEVPSQLFDVVEWEVWILYSLHNIPEVVTLENLYDVFSALHAAEQALLFFNRGEWTPRADAFFHSPDFSEEQRSRLTRTWLEGVHDCLEEWMAQFIKPRMEVGRSLGTNSVLWANDGNLYHCECFAGEAEDAVAGVNVTMIAPEATCARCGLGFSECV